MKLPLTFHRARTQPLSDIVGAHNAIFQIYSEQPIELYVSVMTSRGLAHFDKIVLSNTPYAIPYDPPWGSDWSVLQLEAVVPRTGHCEPYVITLEFEKN
jgi:hypothetical protein